MKKFLVVTRPNAAINAHYIKTGEILPNFRKFDVNNEELSIEQREFLTNDYLLWHNESKSNCLLRLKEEVIEELSLKEYLDLAISYSKELKIEKEKQELEKKERMARENAEKEKQELEKKERMARENAEKEKQELEKKEWISQYGSEFLKLRFNNGLEYRDLLVEELASWLNIPYFKELSNLDSDDLSRTPSYVTLKKAEELKKSGYEIYGYTENSVELRIEKFGITFYVECE